MNFAINFSLSNDISFCFEILPFVLSVNIYLHYSMMKIPQKEWNLSVGGEMPQRFN